MSIILIVGTFSTVFFSQLVGKNALANTQDQIAGEMRKAQLYAMLGRQNGAWGVNYAANVLTLFQGNSYATRNVAFDEKFTIPTSVAISGLSELVYERKTGLPGTSPLTVNITVSPNTKTLTMNTYGIWSK